jgi:hypothetical protein
LIAGGVTPGQDPGLIAGGVTPGQDPGLIAGGGGGEGVGSSKRDLVDMHLYGQARTPSSIEIQSSFPQPSFFENDSSKTVIVNKIGKKGFFRLNKGVLLLFKK